MSATATANGDKHGHKPNQKRQRVRTARGLSLGKNSYAYLLGCIATSTALLGIQLLHAVVQRNSTHAGFSSADVQGSADRVSKASPLPD